MDKKPKFLSYGATLERVQLRYPFLWHLAAFNTLPSYCRLSLNEVYWKPEYEFIGNKI